MHYVYTEKLLKKKCLIHYLVDKPESSRKKPLLLISCVIHDENAGFRFYLHHDDSLQYSPLLVYRMIIDAVEYFERELYRTGDIELVGAGISEMYSSTQQERTAGVRKKKYKEHVENFEYLKEAIKESRSGLN